MPAKLIILTTDTPGLQRDSMGGILDYVGETIEPLTLSVDKGIVKAEFCLANVGDEDWGSGSYDDFPERFEYVGGKYMLKNLIEIVVDSKTKVRPILYDVGDTIALAPAPGAGVPPSRTISDVRKEGFWLTRGWANKTTENNIATLNGPASSVDMGALSIGRHKVDIYIDPDTLTGQHAVYSGFIDVNAMAAVFTSALKVNTKSKK
jgi:hypothetical protein